MNFGSFYARLRLTAAATQSQIKSAYYRLSKIYHPDKNNNCPRATTQFRNITEAYEILADPKAKADYDKSYFPEQHYRGPSTSFRSSYRRRRFQEKEDSTFCEEIDASVQERMKQYRIKIEKKAEVQ